jgi:hypothetical protein
MNTTKIIFIIGMHRSGTSLLTNCLVDNGFSIGKTINQDKDWQNPNGYFENDIFHSFHNKLLADNNSSWFKINVDKMKYTENDIIEYRKLIKDEFKDKHLIVIKDPRLTFFVEFLNKVCEDNYEPYFLFLTRDKNECINSIVKAQNKSFNDMTILYDKTMNLYNTIFLKIDHNDIINDNSNTLNTILNTPTFILLKMLII